MYIHGAKMKIYSPLYGKNNGALGAKFLPNLACTSSAWRERVEEGVGWCRVCAPPPPPPPPSSPDQQ